MSRNWKTVALSASPLLVMTLATTGFFFNRLATHSAPITQQGPDGPRPASRIRNLSLQPEAARVNRRLGKRRFNNTGCPELVLSGTLTVGTNQQHFTLIRRQTDEGESVEVQLPARRFTWSNSDGIKAIPGLVTPSERLLVERLVFDSPDQFVLAQLRGASYFTITKHLRPASVHSAFRTRLHKSTSLRKRSPMTVRLMYGPTTLATASESWALLMDRFLRNQPSARCPTRPAAPVTNQASPIAA